MVLRWNESNLLCDSQAILPAITLIHSGQWILMTVKPGSCEEILQALALVTLVWLSRVGALCHFHLWRCFLTICDVLTLFLFQTFVAQGTHFDLLWELLLCTYSNTRRTGLCHLRNSLLFIVSNPPSHCSFKSSLAFFKDSTTMWKPLHFQKIALSSWCFHTQKRSNFSMGSWYFPVRAWREVSADDTV